MNDIEPLSGSLKGLLKSAQLAPPPEVMNRVRAALQASIEALPVAVPGAPGSNGAAVSKAITAKVVGLGVSTLVVGAGLGVVAGRTIWAPAPVVQERIVRVEVPAPLKAEVPLEGPPAVALPAVPDPIRVPVKAAKERAPSVVSNDEAMRQEQVLLELARVALLRRDTETALKAIGEHAAKFAAGQLAEERESLAIQALILAGDRAAATARLEAFEQRFPQSMLKPSLDAH